MHVQLGFVILGLTTWDLEFWTANWAVCACTTRMYTTVWGLELQTANWAVCACKLGSLVTLVHWPTADLYIGIGTYS